MQGGGTSEVVRPIRLDTLERTGEGASLVGRRPQSRSLGGVQSQIWASVLHLSEETEYSATPHHSSDQNPLFHLLRNRQSSPVVAALLIQLFCITMGQATDTESQ